MFLVIQAINKMSALKFTGLNVFALFDPPTILLLSCQFSFQAIKEGLGTWDLLIWKAFHLSPSF